MYSARQGKKDRQEHAGGQAKRMHQEGEPGAGNRKLKTKEEDLAIVVDRLVDLDNFRHHAREIQFVHGLHRVRVLFIAPLYMCDSVVIISVITTPLFNQ
jgi:hypothetical protein